MEQTLKQVQGKPTESEECMLNLLDFFLFLFKKYWARRRWILLADHQLKTAIKHPQAPQKMMIVAIADIIIYRGAQWRGCGNRTAA
ncbi:hypothetical protein [Flavobacterium sp. XS2P14]|uniref:hypothetical protein n=1 Tax=Flavobacterium sp. XS2P14 TaxID=3401735 RepID=UPI003AAF77CC